MPIRPFPAKIGILVFLARSINEMFVGHRDIHSPAVGVATYSKAEMYGGLFT